MMRMITLILVLILAVSSEQQVNVGLISKAFTRTNITNFQLPRLEHRIPYSTFLENLSRTTQTLLNDVILELYRQARFQSILVSNSVESVNDELQYQLENSNNSYSNYTDHLLKKLNSRLQAYLDLSPGRNNIIHEQDLPSLPSQPNNFHQFVGYHPIEDLFQNLGIIVDKSLANIYLAMHSFYRKGWENAREHFSILQQQFRDEYLNGHLLHDIQIVVENANNKSTLIRQRVKPETWQQFEELRERINSLYNEMKPISNIGKS